MSYITKKQSSIIEQLKALGCEHYRITLKPRKSGLYPQNFGNRGNAANRQKNGLCERFWCVDEILSDQVVRDLTTFNMAGYDIYVTPISFTHHFLVIDDVTQLKLDALLSFGYSPSLIQLSSLDNHQVVLVVPKSSGAGEQSLANSLVVQINQKFGDAKFTGVVHPFRLAGFFNKKEGKNDAETKVLITNSGTVCSKASALLEAARRQSPAGGFSALPARGGAAGELYFNEPVEFDQVAADTFIIFWQQVLKTVKEKGWELDYSRIDFRTAKNMIAVGFTHNQIVSSIVYCSPELRARHGDIQKYAIDTATAASSK